jgi:DNA polymerase-4
MAAETADTLTRRELAACTVTVKVRYQDFTTLTRSPTVLVPTASAHCRAAMSKNLLRRTDVGRVPIRLLGVTTSMLVPATLRQLELFDPDPPMLLESFRS